MCDGKNEHTVGVEFERDQVRKQVNKGLPNRNWSRFRPRPDWIQNRRFFETVQNFVDSFDESIAQARTPLLIPERSGSDFCVRFRMKFDAHDGRRVQSGFPSVRLSTTQATHVLPEHRPSDEGVHQPTQL
jgi:hypothetical protein